MLKFILQESESDTEKSSNNKAPQKQDSVESVEDQPQPVQKKKGKKDKKPVCVFQT